MLLGVWLEDIPEKGDHGGQDGPVAKATKCSACALASQPDPGANSTSGVPRGAKLGKRKAGLWLSQERTWTTSYPTHTSAAHTAESQGMGQAAHQWPPVLGAAQPATLQETQWGSRPVPSTQENTVNLPHAPRHPLGERGKGRDIWNAGHFSKKEKERKTELSKEQRMLFQSMGLDWD